MFLKIVLKLPYIKSSKFIFKYFIAVNFGSVYFLNLYFIVSWFSLPGNLQCPLAQSNEDFLSA